MGVSDKSIYRLKMCSKSGLSSNIWGLCRPDSAWQGCAGSWCLSFCSTSIASSLRTEVVFGHFKDALAHNMHNLQLYWYPTIYILYRVSWARPGPTCPLSWWRSWYIFPAGLNGGLPWKWTQEGFQQALLDLQIFRYSFKNLYTIYNIIHIYNIYIYTYGKSRVWYKPWGPQYVQLT